MMNKDVKPCPILKTFIPQKGLSNVRRLVVTNPSNYNTSLRVTQNRNIPQKDLSNVRRLVKKMTHNLIIISKF